MGQREEYVKVLQSTDEKLRIEQIIERFPKEYSRNPGNYRTALGKLCEEGYVIKHDEHSPYLYSWAGKEYFVSQKKLKNMKKKTKDNAESEKEDEEENKVHLEELVLRALMPVDRKPITEKEISSLIKEKHFSYHACLKRLEKKEYISIIKKGHTNYYSLIREPIRIVYTADGNKSIDLVATLKNYRDDLSSLYMLKSKIDFNLLRLKKVSGLDLTENKTKRKATFSDHTELKEKLRKNITDDNRRKVFAWIVNEWGGVKGDTSIFIKAFDEAPKEKEKILESFARLNTRVASWSKILSFLYPYDYFIYDARVAFTLDFLLGGTKFPVPDGFNSVVNKHVEGRRQPTLDEYNKYCSQIKDIHSKLWPKGNEKDKPYLTEMLLFALLNDVGFRMSIPNNFKLVF